MKQLAIKNADLNDEFKMNDEMNETYKQLRKNARNSDNYDLKRKYNVVLIQLYKPHHEQMKYLVKLLIENDASFNIYWDSVEPQIKIDLQWIDVEDLINISVILDNINSPLYGVEF